MFQGWRTGGTATLTRFRARAPATSDGAPAWIAPAKHERARIRAPVGPMARLAAPASVDWVRSAEEEHASRAAPVAWTERLSTTVRNRRASAMIKPASA